MELYLLFPDFRSKNFLNKYLRSQNPFFKGEEGENIVTFVTQNTLPEIIGLSQKTTEKILSGEIGACFIHFVSAPAKDYNKKIQGTKTIAKEHGGQMLFININSDKEDHTKILETLGMRTSHLPSMRIIKFKRNSPSLNSESVKSGDTRDNWARSVPLFEDDQGPKVKNDSKPDNAI